MQSNATEESCGQATRTDKRPFWARCSACGHCWVVAYLPMDMGTFARLAGHTACPRCGDCKAQVAQQHDGVLQEGIAA